MCDRVKFDNRKRSYTEGDVQKMLIRKHAKAGMLVLLVLMLGRLLHLHGRLEIEKEFLIYLNNFQVQDCFIITYGQVE